MPKDRINQQLFDFLNPRPLAGVDEEYVLHTFLSVLCEGYDRATIMALADYLAENDQDELADGVRSWGSPQRLLERFKEMRSYRNQFNRHWRSWSGNDGCAGESVLDAVKAEIVRIVCRMFPIYNRMLMNDYVAAAINNFTSKQMKEPSPLSPGSGS